MVPKPRHMLRSFLGPISPGTQSGSGAHRAYFNIAAKPTLLRWPVGIKMILKAVGDDDTG